MVWTTRRIYLIGSMRNERIVDIAGELRAEGHSVFEDWISPGPEADDWWQKYEKVRGHTFREALSTPHADNVFYFDQTWLDWADTAVLVLPAGRSAHLEAGWMAGQGKSVYVLFDGEPERYDIMYKLLSDFAFSMDELKEMLA